jgi:hypothetical protein
MFSNSLTDSGGGLTVALCEISYGFLSFFFGFLLCDRLYLRHRIELDCACFFLFCMLRLGVFATWLVGSDENMMISLGILSDHPPSSESFFCILSF